jgi:hypothetical protein
VKRANYKDACYWIAVNDNAGNGDTLEEIEQYITVALIADMWRKPEAQVARDVLNERTRHARVEAGLVATVRPSEKVLRSCFVHGDHLSETCPRCNA